MQSPRREYRFVLTLRARTPTAYVKKPAFSLQIEAFSFDLVQFSFFSGATVTGDCDLRSR